MSLIDASLARARSFLSKAAGMFSAGWADEAGRAAYLAGFHAAKAFIAARSDRRVKTHSGVRTEFARIVKDEPDFTLDLHRFLARSYNFKSTADYGTDPDIVVTAAQAQDAIGTARVFVDTIAAPLRRMASDEPLE